MIKELWKELEFEISTCKECRLHTGRKNVVVGDGNKNSPLMFIGEGPGQEEDEKGIPFVGKAGRLFDKMCKSVGLSREDFYITNIVKCRPPGNRNPEEEEMKICYKYLESQIALINPKIIVTIGAVSTKALLKDPKLKITKERGNSFDWEGGIRLVPILHPSYLLRNNSTEEGSPKWVTWQDMKMIKKEYDNLRS